MKLKLVRVAAGAFAVAAIGACSDEAGDPMGPPSPSRAPSIPAQAGPPTIDDRFLALAQEFPGFGGLFLDTDGVLVVHSVDSTVSPGNRGSLIAFLARERLVRDAESAVATMRIRPNAVSWARLHSEYARMKSVLRAPGVTQTDIDDRENRISIGAQDEQAMEQVVSDLTEAGIDMSLIEVSVIPPTSWSFGNTGSLKKRYRPTMGGIQVSYASSGNECTLGFNVRRLSVGGVDYSRAWFVTASHCTQGYLQLTGRSMGQPYNNSTDRLGVEVADPSPFTSAQHNDCRAGRQCRLSDAALIEYDNQADASFQIGLDDGWWFSASREDVDGLGFVSVGSTVWKSGRTTGTVSGTLKHVCVDVTAYDNGVDTGVDMLCQYQADIPSAGGDSGAPVYTWDGSDLGLVGIFWGTTYDGGYESSSPNILGTFSDYTLAVNELGNAIGGTLVACEWSC